MKTRQELARQLFKGTGVELGVAWGEFSEEILRQQMLFIPLDLEKVSEGLYQWQGTGPIMLSTALDCVHKLYSIDRWTEPHHGMDEYLRALNRLANYGRRSTVLRATFEEARVLFQDGALDFVYVDGYAHTGQEGGKTLEDWWPKIQPGGVMAGHDYDPLFQPTIDAVDAFVARHGLELHLTDGEHLASWWVVKK
jgi:hypothetical protein